MTTTYEARVHAIGPILERLRRERDLRLDDVSALTADLGHRVDPTALWRWENGQRIVNVANLMVLADVYEVSPCFLIGYE